MEENKNPEQAAASASGFGKFESGEALLKAYNSLEAEFTKRSQKLKELTAERENDAAKLQENAQCGRSAESVTDEELLEKIAKNEIMAQKVIDRYLDLFIAQNAPTLITGAGRSALTPVKKPKDLTEAKKLAEMLFRS